MTHNSVQRFLLEDLDIRGAVVHLGSVWKQLLSNRDYPAPIVELLGQMSVTTLLLADNLKQPGRLTIQLRGEGPVTLLVIDCDEALNLRCMAQFGKNIQAAALVDLLGQGQLMISLDLPSMREPYQSVVPLVGHSIAEIFEHYLTHSEQLASRFFLAASTSAAGGLFLQKMPSTDQRDANGWARLEALAGTVQPKELLELSSESLLTRLFNQETVRLFDAQSVTHNVPENREKIATLLLSLGRDEAYAALKERSVIVIRDDLSNHEYRFSKADLDELFRNTPETPPTVH